MAGLRPFAVTVLGVMLSTVMFGWTNGAMNTPAAVMRESMGIPSDEKEPEREIIWAWCVSIYCLGALVGSYSAAQVADRLGRKHYLFLNTIAFIIGACTQALAVVGGRRGIACTLLGRLMVGGASGGATVVVPAYLSEIASDETRGALGVSFQLVVTIAMLLAQFAGMAHGLGTPTLWPTVMLLPALPGAVQLCVMPLLVESPRWLAHAGRTRDAERARALLDGKTTVYTQLAESGSSVTAPTANDPPPVEEHGNAANILANPSLRRSLVLVVVTLVMQQLSGINNAFNYSTIYLQSNHVPSGVIPVVTISMNVVNVAATVVAAWLIDRAGRRVLLLCSSIAMAACTIAITVGMQHLAVRWGVDLAVAGIVGFVASFGLGLGPAPWLLASELFPQRYRASAQGIAAMSNWAANGLVATAFPPLARKLGALSFLPFGVCLGIYSGYALWALPETRGTNLDELDTEMTSTTADEVPAADEQGATFCDAEG